MSYYSFETVRGNSFYAPHLLTSLLTLIALCIQFTFSTKFSNPYHRCYMVPYCALDFIHELLDFVVYCYGLWFSLFSFQCFLFQNFRFSSMLSICGACNLLEDE